VIGLNRRNTQTNDGGGGRGIDLYRQEEKTPSSPGKRKERTATEENPSFVGKDWIWGEHPIGWGPLAEKKSQSQGGEFPNSNLKKRNTTRDQKKVGRTDLRQRLRHLKLDSEPTDRQTIKGTCFPREGGGGGGNSWILQERGWRNFY